MQVGDLGLTLPRSVLQEVRDPLAQVRSDGVMPRRRFSDFINGQGRLRYRCKELNCFRSSSFSLDQLLIMEVMELTMVEKVIKLTMATQMPQQKEHSESPKDKSSPSGYRSFQARS